jgi:hypothetical protein
MSLFFALVLIGLPLIAVFADFVTAGELATRLSRKCAPNPTFIRLGAPRCFGRRYYISYYRECTCKNYRPKYRS